MTSENPYRALPSVGRLLSNQRIQVLDVAAAPLLTKLARQVLEDARAAVSRGTPPPSADQLAENVIALAETVLRPSLRPVINATGVIIHTNLGRVPLSEEAIEAMATVSSGYSNLEFDLESGDRGSRHSHLEAALRELTGAEAAMVVNNNASAVLLALSALCWGREVIISRGQAVEIGGGFRIPDVMRESGARLVEVGTTNRTYLRDYESAITPETAAIMRVHASNFRITGFTETPSIRDLGRLARERGLVLLDDIGSGCLVDTTRFGLAREPTVQESVEAGASVTMFSGDKLLGGPQAGIIVGKGEALDRLQSHPLARAVRIDKASIAGLSATLLHYLRGEAIEKIPIWRVISMSLPRIERRAKRWAREIGQGARAIEGRSMVGGGSLPEESLPTRLIAISGDGARVTQVARRLRLGTPPVVARIEGDSLLLDLRTVEREQDETLVAAVKSALSG